MAMKMTEWIAARGLKRIEAAQLLGVSTGHMTDICDKEGYWPSRPMAEKIWRVTKGKVTPNDFVSREAVQ